MPAGSGGGPDSDSSVPKQIGPEELIPGSCRLGTKAALKQELSAVAPPTILGRGSDRTVLTEQTVTGNPARKGALW